MTHQHQPQPPTPKPTYIYKLKRSQREKTETNTELRVFELIILRDTNMKGKSGKGNWNLSLILKANKLGLPSVILLCSFFFLAGFYASALFSLVSVQDISGARPRSRLLDSVNEEESHYNLLNSGETGDDSITSIPFQVLDFMLFLF